MIYVDDQRNIPIRYEAYSWPKVQGGPPVLDEEYTYVNIQENVGPDRRRLQHPQSGLSL